jgi:hypothetical protein
MATQLHPADPLYLAGLRFDAAAAEFQRICNAPGQPDEDAFGRAETAVETARDEYRRLLGERVGQDADVIERRLAA